MEKSDQCKQVADMQRFRRWIDTEIQGTRLIQMVTETSTVCVYEMLCCLSLDGPHLVTAATSPLASSSSST